MLIGTEVEELREHEELPGARTFCIPLLGRAELPVAQTVENRDSHDVFEHLEASADHGKMGAIDLSPLNDLLTDGNGSTLCNVQDLHVKGPTLDVKGKEDLLGSLASEQLEATLSVLNTLHTESVNKRGENQVRDVSVPRALSPCQSRRG